MIVYFRAEITSLVYLLLETDGGEQKGAFYKGESEANIVRAHGSTIPKNKNRQIIKAFLKRGEEFLAKYP